MKITSKHYKPGTRCKVLADHDDGCGGKVRHGDEVTMRNTDHSQHIAAGPLCEVEKHGHTSFCYIPVQLIKRIKPEKPANPVPAGCPVDQQCHDEMTAAGWKWCGHYMDRGVYFIKGANLFVTGEFDALVGMDFDKAKQVKAGCNILAAWRERSGK